MGLLTAVGLLLPGANEALQWSTASLQIRPWVYLAALPLMLAAFMTYIARKGYPINLRQLYWVAYLLFISVVEELAFRLFLPMLLADAVSFAAAALISSAVFAGLHYLTLRWKLRNCVGVFLGALGLTSLLTNSQDIALVILVHWGVTFLNTPTAPRPAMGAASAQ